MGSAAAAVEDGSKQALAERGRCCDTAGLPAARDEASHSSTNEYWAASELAFQ
jgi:hypothetical protein